MRIATASLRTGLAMTPLTRSAGAAGHMGPALQPYIFVGQGPCALPGVRYGIGGRPRGSPLRKRTLLCVGEGLCPSHGRGRTPPLRRGYKECDAVRNPPVTAPPCQPPCIKEAFFRFPFPLSPYFPRLYISAPPCYTFSIGSPIGRAIFFREGARSHGPQATIYFHRGRRV